MRLWGLTVLALASCARGAVSAGDAATSVQLSRGGCGGGCAPYTVTVERDGRVRFDGRAAQPARGVDSARVNAGAAARLLDLFTQAALAPIDSAYVMGAPRCGAYAADNIITIILVTRPGAARRLIRHDHGCTAAPEQLITWEVLIDSVAGTARWLAPLSGGRP